MARRLINPFIDKISPEEIQQFTCRELAEKYDVSYNTMYNNLKRRGIKPKKSDIGRGRPLGFKARFNETIHSHEVVVAQRVANRLRKYSVIHNLTLHDLAQELGLPYSKTANIVNQRINLTIGLVVTIAEVMGISIDDLIYND